MTRARPSLLLPLPAIAALAIGACQTEKKPLLGFDKPPPGIVIDPSKPGGAVSIWPIFDLPQTVQTFQPRLNAQDVVTVYSNPQEGFSNYDYAKWDLQGWTGGINPELDGVPAGSYVVEVVDAAGQSWGQSAPLSIPVGLGSLNPSGSLNSSGQLPAVIFTHFDDQVGSWNIDPAPQDSDPMTDEITVTNLVAEDVVVERCMIVAGARTSCTPVGTVAPQGDLLTVETVTAVPAPAPLSSSSSSSSVDHQALFIHLASDASKSCQRDLVGLWTGTTSVNTCQIERIVVHGPRSAAPWVRAGASAFALSSCYGYQSSP